MGPDEQAFTAFYRSHHRDVERYVRRRLADDAVRDAVAEVFLVAWRRFAEIPARAELPWLYTVARHTLANELRGSRRVASLRERLQREPVAHEVDPAARVADQLVLAEVFDALPEISREILRLVAWENLSLTEAADVAGCSVPAATMRLHRARQQAHAALERVTVFSAEAAPKTALSQEKEDLS